MKKWTYRVIRVCAVCLVAASSIALGEQRTTIDKAIDGLTAAEIHSIFPRSYDFQLSRTDKRKARFVGYGKKPNDFISFECAPTAVFLILSTSGKKGQINVGECTRQREKVVVAVKNASPGIAGVLEAMKSVGIQVDAKTLEEKMGWKYERTGLPDGSGLHYFPVIAIGHGLLAAPTAVLLSDKSVIVIQAGTTTLCHYGDSDPRFCTDTKKGLFELLKRLYAKSLKN